MSILSSSRPFMLMMVGTVVVAACGRDIAAPTVSPETIRLAGVTVTTPEFTIAGTSADELSGNVVTDGTNALVPYEVNASIKTRLVSQAGVTLATAQTGRTSDTPPLAAFDGTNYLVVWQDATDLLHRVWGMRVNRSGVRVGSPFVLSSATQAVLEGHGVAYAGGKYLVLYHRDTGALMARFVMPNTSLGQTITIAANAGSLPGGQYVATDGTDFLVTYLNGARDSLYSRRVHNDGTLDAPQLIEYESTGSIQGMGVAYNNGAYLVAWLKAKSLTVANPRARRITQAGALNGTAFAIDSKPILELVTSVIPFGTGFVVVYAKVPASGAMTSAVRSVTVGGTVGAEQIYFSKSPTTHKVPFVVGVGMGSAIFFVVNRFKLGADPTNFEQVTALDVHGALLTP